MNKSLVFTGVLALLVASAVAKVESDIVKTLPNSNFWRNLNFTKFDVAGSPEHPHSRLNVLELISYYEYASEKHSVQTDDGYLIELHRITGNKMNPSPNGKPAVFLQHGLLCSSMDWVIAGPKRGLAFLLADAGYDVWMGNARGSRYSRKHKDLAIEEPEFWEFSWHQIGHYDLPAMIDYVLKHNGNKKLTYVGHSQGSTTFFVMLSERPEYNAKITMMFSLAPIAYLSHMTSPVFRILGALSPTIEKIMALLGQYEFKPSGEFFKEYASGLCGQGQITQLICKNVLFLICGYSEEQLDTDLLPAILNHVPAGASTKQFVHYAQLIHSGHFRQYDFGWIRNLAKYQSITPPPYKFKNVQIPVSLHYSSNDWLSHPIDVQQIYSKLPNAIGKFRVPHDKFNHLDFLWAKDVKPLLYDKVLSLMNRYNKK